MNSMKTFLSLVAALCLAAGCTTSPKSADETAVVPCDSLCGKAVQVDSVLFRYAYRLRVQGDVAVVFDLHHPDYYCHAFTYPDFKYLSSFAPLGEGPDEVVSGSDVRFLGPNRVAVLDSNGRKIAIYNGVGKGTAPVLERMVRMEEAVLMPLDFVPLSGGSFLIPDNSGEHRFSVIDSCGKVQGSKAAYPISEKELLTTAAPAVAQAWRSFLAVTPKQDQLVAVTQLGDVMDCYSLPESAKEKVHSVGPDGEPVFSVTAEGYGIPKGCMGYWDVQATDSCIYALYDGTTFKEIMQQRGESKQGASVMRVFDLSGKPLHTYVFDRPLAGMFVDEARKTLWATDVNSDEQLVSYVLK